MPQYINTLSKMNAFDIKMAHITFGAFNNKQEAKCIIDSIIWLYEEHNKLLEKYEELSKLVYWLSFVDKNSKSE